MQPSTSRLAGLVQRTRPLPARKQVLYSSTQHLLTSNDLVLFLRPGDFSAQEWRSLRSQIASISQSGGDNSSTKLTLLRPGLLPALLRSSSTSSASASSLDLSHLSQSSHLTGPLAVLTCSTLSPPLLSKLLSLVSKISKTPAPNSPPPPPNSPPVERLSVLSSILEKRVAKTQEETVKVGKLPELDVLRSQLVGLLGMPASRIVGVVGARAREVGRTVEGFKEGLKESTTQTEEAKA
ncbi:uncharacterized protein JCM6883_002379 [Sporobolomyces salmoneus]|uniref:uncharacterized protein n=1 Tax=Sporobolomyces salmoneus TaxID=183962 RepID=UPI00317BAFD5